MTDESGALAPQSIVPCERYEVMPRVEHEVVRKVEIADNGKILLTDRCPRCGLVITGHSAILPNGNEVDLA